MERLNILLANKYQDQACYKVSCHDTMRMSLCPNAGGDADQYRGGESDLLGPGPHLPPLPLEPPHTLLSPLSSHNVKLSCYV